MQTNLREIRVKTTYTIPLENRLVVSQSFLQILFGYHLLYQEANIELQSILKAFLAMEKKVKNRSEKQHEIDDLRKSHFLKRRKESIDYYVTFACKI